MYNGDKIDLNEDRFVETFFNCPGNPIVTVLETYLMGIGDYF